MDKLPPEIVGAILAFGNCEFNAGYKAGGNHPPVTISGSCLSAYAELERMLLSYLYPTQEGATK